MELDVVAIVSPDSIVLISITRAFEKQHNGCLPLNQLMGRCVRRTNRGKLLNITWRLAVRGQNERIERVRGGAQTK